MLRGIWEFPKLLNSIKKKKHNNPKQRSATFPHHFKHPVLPFPQLYLYPSTSPRSQKFWELLSGHWQKKHVTSGSPLSFFALFLVIISLSLSVYKFVYALYGPLFLVSFFRECLPRFAKKLSHTTAVHFECLQHFLLRHDRQLREEVVITDSCHGCTILPCLSSELGPVALWWSNKNREHQIPLQHLWTFLEWSLSHLTWWKPSWIRKISPHFSWPCLQTHDIMAS